jgi:hypothetical protein
VLAPQRVGRLGAHISYLSSNEVKMGKYHKVIANIGEGAFYKQVGQWLISGTKSKSHRLMALSRENREEVALIVMTERQYFHRCNSRFYTRGSCL